MKKLPSMPMSALTLSVFILSMAILHSQSRYFDAVSLADIAAAPLSGTTIRSGPPSNALSPGTIVVFNTSEGRYGKFLVRESGFDLVLDYVTYYPDGEIFDQCRDLTIRENWYADLDAGLESRADAFSDFWWQKVKGTERYLIPQNNAQMAIYQFPDFRITLRNTPSFARPGQALGAELEVQVLEFTPGIPPKDVWVDLVLLPKPVYRSPAPLAEYTPFFKPGVLLQEGRQMVTASFGATPVRFNGSCMIPEDTPPGLYYLAAVADAGNLVIELNERNNVAYAAIWIDERDVFSALTMNEIQAQNLSAVALNGNEGRFNQLNTGSIIVYKTDEGRFGKMLIKSYGANLLVDWVTFHADGSVFSRGANKLLEGGYLYDLDFGLLGTAGADLWWEQRVTGERFLVPMHGTMIGVYTPINTTL